MAYTEVKQGVYIYPIFSKRFKIDTLREAMEVNDKLINSLYNVLWRYDIIEITIDQRIDNLKNGLVSYKKSDEPEWNLDVKYTIDTRIHYKTEPHNGIYYGQKGEYSEITGDYLTLNKDELLKELQKFLPLKDISIFLGNPNESEASEKEPDWDLMPGGHDYYQEYAQ